VHVSDRVDAGPLRRRRAQRRSGGEDAPQAGKDHATTRRRRLRTSASATHPQRRRDVVKYSLGARRERASRRRDPLGVRVNSTRGPQTRQRQPAQCRLSRARRWSAAEKTRRLARQRAPCAVQCRTNGSSGVSTRSRRARLDFPAARFDAENPIGTATLALGRPRAHRHGRRPTDDSPPMCWRARGRKFRR